MSVPDIFNLGKRCAQFYDVISQITNLSKEEVDMSTYLGQVHAVMEEFERSI